MVARTAPGTAGSRTCRNGGADLSLTPKNWASFQHYKDRKPAWIKLHRVLLDDYDFACLPDASRALAPCIWLLASEYEAGNITASVAEIAFRLRMSESKLQSALTPLINSGFLIASDMLAECYQGAIPEKERETQVQTEREGESIRSPRKARRALSPFPENWDLGPKESEAASEQGWVQGRAETEFQRFRDHALSHDRRAKDWSAAWRSWVTSPYQKPPNTNGSARKDRKAEDWDDARADLQRSINRESESRDQSTLRLLPSATSK